jgi:hypothetical protein
MINQFQSKTPSSGGLRRPASSGCAKDERRESERVKGIEPPTRLAKTDSNAPLPVAGCWDVQCCPFPKAAVRRAERKLVVQLHETSAIARMTIHAIGLFRLPITPWARLVGDAKRAAEAARFREAPAVSDEGNV